MKLISVDSLAIPSVKSIKFERFHDNRGYFTETFRQTQFDDIPRLYECDMASLKFKQSNESYSGAGVLRGLHFQFGNYAMGKMVRVIRGQMYDLALDLRIGSPTFGVVLAHAMQSTNVEKFSEWIWVPPGFAHGTFFTQDTVIEYFCTAEHAPSHESGICPFAKDLDWSLAKEAKDRIDTMMVVSSPKDREAQTLTQWLSKPEAQTIKYENV